MVQCVKSHKKICEARVTSRFWDPDLNKRRCTRVARNHRALYCWQHDRIARATIRHMEGEGSEDEKALER
jgi:hypothetical protein